MAIDVCSEISGAGVSPRISFSRDLNQPDIVSPNHARLDSSLLESDFSFLAGNFFFSQELSSADELFSNGRILPSPVKIKNILRSIENLHHPANPPERTTSSEKKMLKEFLSDDSDEQPPPESKSFWKVRRSSSLNGENGRNRGSIRSLHFLSRSNSTSSSPNPKPLTVLTETKNQKPNLRRQHSIPIMKSSSSWQYACISSQRSSMAKSCGSHSNGVRISPVLNQPPPYIAQVTVNFLGFGSLFFNGKIKKKKN